MASRCTYVQGDSYQMNIHCSYCDTFNTTSERQAKCETCHTDVSYKCELCNDYLPSYSNLQSHVLNVHIMDTEMCLENKDDMSEDLEGKNNCDEINKSDHNGPIDNDKQRSIKERVTTNYDRPKEQKLESVQIDTVEVQETFHKLMGNLNKKHAVLDRFEGDDDKVTNESNDGMDDVLVPNYSGDPDLVNEKCLEDKKDIESISLKRKHKTSGIKRYCLRCDKIKKDLKVIRIGNKKEICEKCRSELLYQCVKCKRKSKNYSVMVYHWKHYCALLRPKCSTFIVQLTAPEKLKNSNVYKAQRHQCRLCPYSSNLKNRLMLHLQMHSWKDIKSALVKS